MPRTPAEGTRHAVDLMSAWLDVPDGPPDRFVECLRKHIEENPTRDRLGAAVELIMGMTQLGGGLLVLLEEATGTPASQTLQEFARLYALG